MWNKQTFVKLVFANPRQLQIYNKQETKFPHSFAVLQLFILSCNSTLLQIFVGLQIFVHLIFLNISSNISTSNKYYIDFVSIMTEQDIIKCCRKLSILNLDFVNCTCISTLQNTCKKYVIFALFSLTIEVESLTNFLFCQFVGYVIEICQLALVSQNELEQ